MSSEQGGFVDQATLTLLKDGLRHVKGLMATVDKWVIVMEDKLKKEARQTMDPQKGSEQ
jgi:hypothetical protein